MTRFTLAGAVALVALSVAPSAKADEVTFKQAYAIAQEACPDGTLFMARYESQNTIFGFYFQRLGRVNEIEVSKSKGKIVKNKDSEKDGSGKAGVAADVLALIQKNTKEKTKLPMGRLLEIASESLKDTPFTQMAFDKDGDRLIVRVGEGTVIDAQTGAVTVAPKK
jgi:hypothetical protein